MLDWFSKKVTFKELPLFVIWEVWKSRNMCIFEDKKESISQVCYIVISIFLEYHKNKKKLRHGNLIQSQLDDYVSVGFFMELSKIVYVGLG